MMDFPTIAKRIEEVLDKLDNVDVRVPEDSALISLASDLVPVVLALLREGLELFGQIEKAYGPERQLLDLEQLDSDPFSLKGIGFLISSEFAARDLQDLAFFARSELKGCLEVLLATADKHHTLESLASNLEAGTRRLRKALVSVESAIYEFEQARAPIRKWFDVEVSLQIRKLYWNLRRETVGQPADSHRLADRMRSVVYRLVAFRELSVYPFLRIDDRIQLRQLLKRLLEWLNSPARDHNEGKRLWADLASFAELLVQVSQRQELQEHDLALVSRACQTLFRKFPPPEKVPVLLFSELEALLGLDDELDQLIVQKNIEPVEDWRTPLERVRDQLNRPEEPIPSINLFNE